MTRIACCQLDPVLGDLDANSGLIESAVADAVGAGADIVVLPELATSGYMFADGDEARVASLPATDPRFAKWSGAVSDSLAVLGFSEWVRMETCTTVRRSSIPADRLRSTARHTCGIGRD
ncbi:nitrilase-related carbon-nitrogen hydrolase [Mycolicibacterium iranicum]|uniref:nitrilase-related carbon-nitrogen hydrolase n=1 Tax=Mycolicibacterium iranicum TaxID=912594 RepID=UPI002351F5F9|nr:nitrilase-related carbon-nitrogen hydrolase [Mycolicibacterium iranicum]